MALLAFLTFTVSLLVPRPIHGQPPAACTAAYLSGPNISQPSDRPDEIVGAPYGHKSFTGVMTNSRTFRGTLRARAADTSGMSILLCLLRSECTLDTLWDWLAQFWDWGSFSKGQVARIMDVQYQGPSGSEAQIRIDGSLDGLLGVSAFLVGVSTAKVTADLWALPPESGSWRDILHREVEHSAGVLGVQFTHVTGNGSVIVTMTPGQLLRLEGSLRAEARSWYLYPYGAAIGMSQFLDSPGIGFPSIPNPGLNVTATIVNVTPVLAADQTAVPVTLGQVASASGTLCDGDGDRVTLAASIGTVTDNRNGTWSWSLPAGAPFQSRTVTITADDGHGGVRHTSFDLLPRLSIDVQPKTTKNIIDLRSQGTVPVAILSGGAFDPLSDVQQDSVRFGRTGDENSLLRLGDVQKPACAGFDVNGDGLWDLVCSFRVSQTGFACGANTAVLKAVVPALGAAHIEGRDPVTLVPCNTIQAPTVVYEGSPGAAGFAGVAVSPDGARLYVARGDGIFRLAKGGGSLVPLNVGVLGQVNGLAVSPDGSRVFATLAGGGLAEAQPAVVSLPASGGAATVVAYLPAGSRPGGVAVSRDGARLFIAMDSSVVSLPVAGGTPLDVVSNAGGGVQDVELTSTGETLYLGVDGVDQILASAMGGPPSIVPTGIAFADPVNITITPDDATLFVLDPNVRVDALGNVVAAGGWPGAVFVGPGSGGIYLPLVVGGPEFGLQGRIAVSPDGSVLYFTGFRRGTLAPVVLSVPTALTR